MKKIQQIEKCMKMQCDFCNRKSKCDREIEKEEYGTNTRTSK